MSLATDNNSVFVDLSPIVGYPMGIAINSLVSEQPLYWQSLSDEEVIEQGGFLQSPGMPLGVFFDSSEQSIVPKSILALCDALPFLHFEIIQASLVSKEARELAESAPILFVLLVNFCRKNAINKPEFQTLVTQKRREVLKYCGLPSSGTFLKLLTQMHFRAIDRISFTQVIDSLSEQSVQESLRHVKQPCFNHLYFLAKYQGTFWPNLLAIIHDEMSYRELQHLVQLAQDTSQMTNIQVLQPIKTRVELQRLHDELVRQINEINNSLQGRVELAQSHQERYGSYPTPPIPGNEHIEPLTSWLELIEEGKIMRHCVASYHSHVASGRSFIYRTNDKQRLTISIAQRVNGTWALEQIYGFSNSKPIPKALEQVQQWFLQNH